MGFGRVFPTILGKFIIKLTKITGSGGTALPGLVVEYLNPNFLKEISTQIKIGSVLVTGTNGKTTTSRILSDILLKTHKTLIHNRSGSNLLRGITTSLIQKSNFLSKLDVDYGVFEVDEFVFPLALEKINTPVAVINNLFRDQLDRYGEIETIRSRWAKSLKSLDKDTFVILNADDPTVAHLGKNLRAKVLYFGLDDTNYISKNPPHASDSLKCQNCGNFLYFDYFYLAHMGVYKCGKCQFERPKLNVSAKNLRIHGTAGVSFDLQMGGNTFKINLALPGLYNVYNTLAAATAAAALGLNPSAIELGLKDLKPAFGRGEQLEIDNKYLYLALVKNPAGFNEVLRLLNFDQKKKNILIIINDLIADSRDVSWLWDVDFEQLEGVVSHLTVSGLRSNDMALRLKYALKSYQKLDVSIEEDASLALNNSLAKLNPGETLYILPTYTAMLQIRKVLEKRTGLKNFSED